MLTRQDFPDRQSLAEALARHVGAQIGRGVAQRGTASIAVSGGSTPKLFFSMLAAQPLVDWSKTTVTLVDERWVDETSDRSNARLVRQHMAQGAAQALRFVPLYAGGDTPTLASVEASNRNLDTVPMPFDAVILGMGNDGHTASFFPGGDALAQALSEAGPAIAITAPGAGEPRVTLTLPRLLQTRSLCLHIEGEDKARTLAAALEDGPVETMPVRAVLRQAEVPVQVFWCP